MDRKSPSDRDRHDLKISQLEAELNNTYRALDREKERNQFLKSKNLGLKQENEHLRTQIAQFRGDIEDDFERSRSPRDSRRKTHTYEAPDPIQLSWIINIAVGIIVAVLIIGVGWKLTRRSSSQSGSPTSRQPYTTPTPPPNSNSNPNFSPSSPNLQNPQISSSPSLPPLPTLQASEPNFVEGSNDIFYSQFQESEELQNIVDRVIDRIKIEGLPIDDISITLINTKNNEVAVHSGQKLRFPASVIKIFWMYIAYHQLSTGKYRGNSNQIDFYLDKMIIESDNNSGSHILDAITQAPSGNRKSGQDFKKWYRDRLSVNNFFDKRGYGLMNISQKTFPITIPESKYLSPEGLDLQIREQKIKGIQSNPTRNRITTNQAARLMFEIMKDDSILGYTQLMQDRLQRNLDPNVWQKRDPNQGEFNSIQAFFGEFFANEIYPDNPQAIEIWSKAGWTSQTRQEVAYIESQQYETRYILAVFCENKKCSESKSIFPDIAREVFEQMKFRKSNY